MTELDKLLKVIAEAEAKKVESRPKKGQTGVERFVSDLGISHGLDKVPTYVIFYAYRIIWQGDYKPNKKNKIVFFRLFNKMFNQIRSGKQRYYLLNKDKFDMTREGLQKAKYYEERYSVESRRKIKETKKNKKTKSKVSESTEGSESKD